MNLLNIFILSFGGLQGLLLAALLMRRKERRGAHLFLLFYLLTLLMQTVLKIAGKVWLMQNMPVVYGLSYHLPFLYGPLLYGYVLEMTSSGGQRRFGPASAWHLLPFFGYILLGNFRAILPDKFSPLFWFRAPEWICCLQLLSLTAYHWRAFVRIGRQTRLNNESGQWLRRHVITSFLVTGSICAGLYLIHLYYSRYAGSRFLFAAITLYVYWLSYEAMRRPHLLGLATDDTPAPRRSGQQDVENAFEPPARKYENSALSPGESDRILTNLLWVMEQQRPYLNPDLNIDTLAGLAGTHRHHLSQVLNSRLHKNFYEFLNDYRVKAAGCLLSDPACNHLKIAAIAYDAGFNSLSTFNDVFKKTTGCTPSEYRKRLPSVSAR